MEKKTPKKLVLDIETYGLNIGTDSILTLYMGVLDSNFKIEDELDLKLIPDSGVFVGSDEALKVNKINLEEHRKTAIPYSEARLSIEKFLDKNSAYKRSLTPSGHNIAGFDIPFIVQSLDLKEVWDTHCHYRLADTSPILNFLQDLDLLPRELGSLESLVKYFKVPKLQAHTAKGDSLMWVEVYKSLIQVISKKGSSSIEDLLLLE
jgi:DNA polymerase III alpha subunit (gram-positive type)